MGANSGISAEKEIIVTLIVIIAVCLLVYRLIKLFSYSKKNSENVNEIGRIVKELNEQIRIANDMNLLLRFHMQKFVPSEASVSGLKRKLEYYENQLKTVHELLTSYQSCCGSSVDNINGMINLINSYGGGGSIEGLVCISQKKELSQAADYSNLESLDDPTSVIAQAKAHIISYEQYNNLSKE